MPRLRSLIVGGAPSSRRLCRAMVTAFPRCEHTIIYGSTEAEPISSIEMREVLESGGPGYLVGRPYSLARVEVVRLAEEAPSLRPGALSEHRVEQGTHGEVVVTGPQVVRSYVNDEAAERRLKVREGEGIVWHRTGDEALRDAEGRLWLGGRTTERVVTSAGVIQPFVVEAPVTALEGVRSAAFVATSPHKPPVLAVELEPGGALEPAREALAAGPGAGAQVVTVDAMPVDARHQSKVDRARLRVLLAKRGL